MSHAEQAAKRKSWTKAVTVLAVAGALSLAAGASVAAVGPASRRWRTRHAQTLSARNKSPTSGWRLSMFSKMKMPEDMLPAYNLSKNVATQAHWRQRTRGLWRQRHLWRWRGLWGLRGWRRTHGCRRARRHVGRCWNVLPRFLIELPLSSDFGSEDCGKCAEPNRLRRRCAARTHSKAAGPRNQRLCLVPHTCRFLGQQSLGCRTDGEGLKSSPRPPVFGSGDGQFDQPKLAAV